MFITILFTTDKLWNLLRCPSTDEQMKEIWYVNKMDCYSVTKKTKRFSLQENGWNWKAC
jgi:hypothetical protein